MQGTPEHPKAPLGNNFRPPQPLLHRPVRTNIDFRTKQNGKLCPSMYRDVHYKGKRKWIFIKLKIIYRFYFLVLFSLLFLFVLFIFLLFSLSLCVVFSLISLSISFCTCITGNN